VAPVGVPRGAHDPPSSPAATAPATGPPWRRRSRERGDGATFVAVVTHLKSKGSACDAPDAGDGQGDCNMVRTAATAQLAAWLAADPTGTGDPDVLARRPQRLRPGGPGADARGCRLRRPVAPAPGRRGTTYGFDGQWGTLDYALASPSLAGQVTGAAAWHVNADEPNVLDYNGEFKSRAQQASLYAPDAFRSSDHDPLVVGLELDTTP
jgi:uncharacterized protein